MVATHKSKIYNLKTILLLLAWHYFRFMNNPDYNHPLNIFVIRRYMLNPYTIRPSLRDLSSDFYHGPANELAGYFRMSLRDKRNHRHYPGEVIAEIAAESGNSIGDSSRTDYSMPRIRLASTSDSPFSSKRCNILARSRASPSARPIVRPSSRPISRPSSWPST